MYPAILEGRSTFPLRTANNLDHAIIYILRAQSGFGIEVLGGIWNRGDMLSASRYYLDSPRNEYKVRIWHSIVPLRDSDNMSFGIRSKHVEPVKPSSQ